jgi:AcrR family transcriptional regulator
MTPERTGGGDPARSIELLWRIEQPVRRGPKPRLTIDRIVQAAITLADAEGLAALSMRRLAEQLSVTAMSLYTYVPGKAELLDLMIDMVCGRMERTEPADEHWRSKLEAIARDNRALSERHPWIAAVATSRPPLGPGVITKYEYELSALDGLGLTDVEMDSALTFLLMFVAGCAQAVTDARAVTRDSAMSDEQWWERNAPLLERVFDARRFPVSSRVGAAAGEAYGAAYSDAHAFDFGLGRVLDGLGVLIESRAGVGMLPHGVAQDSPAERA